MRQEKVCVIQVFLFLLLPEGNMILVKYKVHLIITVTI